MNQSPNRVMKQLWFSQKPWGTPIVTHGNQMNKRLNLQKVLKLKESKERRQAVIRCMCRIYYIYRCKSSHFTTNHFICLENLTPQPYTWYTNFQFPFDQSSNFLATISYEGKCIPSPKQTTMVTSYISYTAGQCISLKHSGLFSINISDYFLFLLQFRHIWCCEIETLRLFLEGGRLQLFRKR